MTRQEQKEERRKVIMMTGMKLFVEKGYHDTKVSDIAAAVPMSVGLLFHYFESKEELLLELVKMGAASATSVEKMGDVPAEFFFREFLKQLFAYAKDEPWVFLMFVLMGQARHPGMPEEARKIALGANQIDITAKIIEKGQKSGSVRSGDAKLMALSFWAAVQGIMEEMAMNPEMKAPDPEWIAGMILTQERGQKDGAEK